MRCGILFGTGRGSAGARREKIGGSAFFLFLFSTKTKKVQRYLLVGRVYLHSEKWKRGRVKVSTGSLLCMYICKVCIHVGGTYLPIPSRSGRDDVDTSLDTCSRTPVNDDSDIGKCDMYFFSVCWREIGRYVAWRYSTVGKSSHLAGHLPEKKKRSSGTRFTSCEQPTHAREQ